MEEVLQLKKDNRLKIKIVDSEGIDTGEYLEFDLEDIDLPLRLNKCDIMHKNNMNGLKIQLSVIEKKEDHKGKYLLSWKEEESLKVIKEFYNREIEALDLFLGKGGTAKLLNGRQPYYEMFDDIKEMLEPIIPKLENQKKAIVNKVKEKYKKTEEGLVIE